MATGGEHAAAAAAVEGEHGELLAPNGWTKKLNPIHGGKFEVVFVSSENKEFKSKRALSKYLSANPGGPAASEFNWGMGNTPRRSSRISEKAKATESPEDEKPPKRERSSSSKRGKKGKQEDAPAETGDHAKAKDTDVEMKDANSAQEEKKEADNAQEEKKEADDTQEEMKQAENAQEEKKEADDGQEEMKQAENAEEEKKEADDAQEEMKQAENAEEEKKEAPDTDAAEKTEGERKAEVSEVPSEVLAPVTEKGDEKLAESEVAPVESVKDENGPAMESAVPPPVSSQENKEEADSTINPATPPPVETKVDVPAAEAAKDAENSADNAAHKDGQVDAASGEQSTANCDNKGQIQPGASTVKCT